MPRVTLTPNQGRIPPTLLPQSPQHPGGPEGLWQGVHDNCVLHCSWKTTSTSLWTQRTSASRPPCRPARGCWRPWRPFTAPPPMTGPGTGTALRGTGSGAGDGREASVPFPGLTCPPNLLCEKDF